MNSLVERRLADLKAEGTAPVAAIKTIHIEFGLPLSAAKLAFSASPAWAEEAANGEKLHEEVFKFLGASAND